MQTAHRKSTPTTQKKNQINFSIHNNKWIYITLKFFEYFIFREIDSLFEYLKKEIQSSIIHLTNSNDLKNLDRNKNYIIGYFNNQNSFNYKTFLN